MRGTGCVHETRALMAHSCRLVDGAFLPFIRVAAPPVGWGWI